MTPTETNAYKEALKRINACKKVRATSLDLSALDLVELPPEIGKLTKLTELNLSRNRLERLPTEFTLLKSLSGLWLYENQFELFPQEICELRSLAILSLHTNHIKEIPSSIQNLNSLHRLSLQSNLLRRIPPEIGKLTSLQTLSISNNKLTTLPLALTKLVRLGWLSVAGNRLRSLPKEIGLLSELTELLLHDNQLRALPRELANLKALGLLLLHGNPNLKLPQSILGPTFVELQAAVKKSPAVPQDILQFYLSRKKQGSAPLQELRMLMVGRGRVGKTSLLKALMQQRPDALEAETPGITVNKLILQCPRGPATANVWDFGGQEFLHGTHQIFLSERCLYVLVLEGREGNWEAETDYWIRFIHSFGGDSPVVVVLNKHAVHPFSVDTFRLRERCPQIVGFVNTDALTGLGIAELKTLLEKTIESMDDVWLGVPRNWHRIKRALERLPERYLDYPMYRKLCQSRGVKDTDEQDSLAATLHRLGVAMNFQDHHRLRHTSVLKPEWVTEAIYGLIRYTQQQKSNGVLESSWLAQALPPSDYPPDKHPFVLELMEKFEVAFALDGKSRWLLPELLGETQPAEFAEFKSNGIKRLRFTYPDAMPPGLLPRLIVRTNDMSEKHQQWRWRSGVVLEWGKCRALVLLNRMERRTEIAVIECPQQSQQNLFDLIRAHLTILHGNVRVIEEVELEGHRDSWVRLGKLRLLEGEGMSEIKEETKEGGLARVKVTETLDAVSSAESRLAHNPNGPKPMRLFVSYAHAEEKRLKPLSKHLTILGNRGYIQTWQDTQLVAGENWKDRILTELKQAEIVLLLYSTHSRASTFIQQTEGPIAVQRTKDQPPARLIVVPLDRKDWDPSVPLEQALGMLQTATWNAKPVLDYSPKTKGWDEVEHAIKKVVLELRQTTMTKTLP